MYYLKDYCALIMSGFTLYNGLSATEGIVAAYEKQTFARTLIKHETLSSKDDLKNMLRMNTRYQVNITPFESGPVDFCVCVPEHVGTNGLEEYLSSRGFITSNYDRELEASDLIMNKLKRVPPKTTVPYNIIPNGDSNKGKEIASAITLSHITLTGKYGCASNRGSQYQYKINMNSPLDMGEMKFKVIAEFSEGIKKGLVFINGNLRILTSTGNLEQPINQVVWDIYPKFDSSKNSGLMSRLSLDILLVKLYKFRLGDITTDKVEKVLLGCYNDSRDD